MATGPVHKATSHPVSSSKLLPQARGLLSAGHLLLHWEPTTEITQAGHRWKGQSLGSRSHCRGGLGSICNLNPCSRDSLKGWKGIMMGNGARSGSPQPKRCSGVDPSRAVSALDTESAAPCNSPCRRPQKVVPSSKSVIWVSIHHCARAGHYLGSLTRHCLSVLL